MQEKDKVIYERCTSCIYEFKYKTELEDYFSIYVGN